jgi:hypothetical protein
MKKFNIIALILILSSCTSVPQFQPVNLVETTLIDYPEKGIVVFATLGERLVAKGYKQDGPAYEIEAGMLVDNDESFFNCSLATNTRQSNFISRKNTSNGDMCAGPFYYYWIETSGETTTNCNGTSQTTDICFSNAESKFYLQRKPDFVLNQNLVTKTRKQTTSSTNFVQELIYNGRVDNNIKFIYREFSEDMIRPAFNQTVQYDFNDSKFISFKGLTLEIIEANNQLIRYKLISNF